MYYGHLMRNIGKSRGETNCDQMQPDFVLLKVSLNLKANSITLHTSAFCYLVHVQNN